jgi:hypothetical protein
MNRNLVGNIYGMSSYEDCSFRPDRLTSVAKSAVHINIYVITWIVSLCYYNGHIRNPLTSVLFLIKTWHKRYLFVKDELINTYRLLSLDYHLFGINI